MLSKCKSAGKKCGRSDFNKFYIFMTAFPPFALIYLPSGVRARNIVSQ